jgi:hypothetical protein
VSSQRGDEDDGWVVSLIITDRRNDISPSKFKKEIHFVYFF